MIKNGCGQSADGTLKLAVSEELSRLDKLVFCMLKLKIDQNFFGWAWSKMGVTNLLVMGL